MERDAMRRQLALLVAGLAFGSLPHGVPDDQADDYRAAMTAVVIRAAEAVCERPGADEKLVETVCTGVALVFSANHHEPIALERRRSYAMSALVAAFAALDATAAAKL